MKQFNGLDRAYLQIHKELVCKGSKGVASRVGENLELLNACFKLSDPSNRMCTVRRPLINLPFVVAETVWIFQGRNDLRFLDYWNSEYKNYTGNQSILNTAYGYRLRKFHKTDQLERAIDVLQKTSESRQVLLQIWDASDLPSSSGLVSSKDVPCNVVSLLKVRKGKLFWTQIMRSNDIMLGLPYNVFQWTTIQALVAASLELELGNYVHYADSLHRYNDYKRKYVVKKSQKIAYEGDGKLRIRGRSVVAEEMKKLEEVIEILIGEGADKESIVTKIELKDGLLGDFKRILYAESMRKDGKKEKGLAIISEIGDNKLRTAMKVRFGV